MNGGDHVMCGFSHPAVCYIALQHLVAYVNQPKALVTSEYCHYQHAHKQNG